MHRVRGPADAAELVDEVHVPGGAAELAVGRGLQPDGSCIRTTSRIAPSSTVRSPSSDIRPAAWSARARCRRPGRSRLPTWSARKGGRSRIVMRSSPGRRIPGPARLPRSGAPARDHPGLLHEVSALAAGLNPKSSELVVVGQQRRCRRRRAPGPASSGRACARPARYAAGSRPHTCRSASVNTRLANRDLPAADDRYDSMTYRRCGRSGLQLPADLARAVAQLRRRPAAARPSARSCRRAFDLGITHFDLANNYGPPYGVGRGELRPDPRRRPHGPTATSWSSRPRPATTCGPGPYGDWGSRKYLLGLAGPVAAPDGAGLRRHLLLAPVRPGHAARGDDGRAGRARSAPGKALYVGISSYNSRADPARRRRSCATSGTPLLIHQPSYSMLNRWIEARPPARHAGGGRRRLHRLLAAGPGPAHRPLPAAASRPTRGSRPSGSLDDRESMLTERTLAQVRALDEIAERRGQSLAQLALAWALRDPRMTQPGHRRQQRRAARGRTSPRSTTSSFTDDELAEIDRHAVESGIDLWAGVQRRSSRHFSDFPARTRRGDVSVPALGDRSSAGTGWNPAPGRTCRVGEPDGRGGHASGRPGGCQLRPPGDGACRRLWRLDREMTETALLLVSELATNAIRHGTPPVRLSLRLDRDRLRVEVTDSSPALPELSRPGRTRSVAAGCRSSSCSRRGGAPAPSPAPARQDRLVRAGQDAALTLCSRPVTGPVLTTGPNRHTVGQVHGPGAAGKEEPCRVCVSR